MDDFRGYFNFFDKILVFRTLRLSQIRNFKVPMYYYHSIHQFWIKFGMHLLTDINTRHATVNQEGFIDEAALQ